MTTRQKPPKAKVKPSAEHYSETSILTTSARLHIYTAQDSSGKYYGGFAIEWSIVSLPNYRSPLTPAKCKKFDLLDLAYGHQLHEARGYVERLRLNHLTDEQLAAIQVVEAKIDQTTEAFGTAALAEPVAPTSVDLADELKVNIVGLSAKKKIVTMMTCQPRSLPLPKSIATLVASKKPRGKK